MSFGLEITQNFATGATVQVVPKRPVEVLVDKSHGSVGHENVSPTSVQAEYAWPVIINP